MTQALLQWMSSRDTGASSEAIALTALGAMPENPSYPSDAGDFGRCYRLIKEIPEAAAGLEKLKTEGGPHWRALGERWGEITATYEAETGGAVSKTYRLMKEILQPIERSDPFHTDLGNGLSVRFGA